MVLLYFEGKTRRYLHQLLNFFLEQKKKLNMYSMVTRKSRTHSQVEEGYTHSLLLRSKDEASQQPTLKKGFFLKNQVKSVSFIMNGLVQKLFLKECNLLRSGETHQLPHKHEDANFGLRHPLEMMPCACNPGSRKSRHGWNPRANCPANPINVFIQ